MWPIPEHKNFHEGLIINLRLEMGFMGICKLGGPQMEVTVQFSLHPCGFYCTTLAFFIKKPQLSQQQVLNKMDQL